MLSFAVLSFAVLSFAALSFAAVSFAALTVVYALLFAVSVVTAHTRPCSYSVRAAELAPRAL